MNPMVKLAQSMVAHRQESIPTIVVIERQDLYFYHRASGMLEELSVYKDGRRVLYSCTGSGQRGTWHN